MKKSSFTQKSVVSLVLGITLMCASAHAQKDYTGTKDGAPRTTDNRTTPVKPVEEPVPATVTTLPPTNPNPPTVVTPPTSPGVNGTTDVPTTDDNGPLHKKTQIPGVQGVSKEGDGKSAGKRVRPASDTPAEPVQVPAVSSVYKENQTSQADPVTPKDPCGDDALKKIYEILQKDQSGVLSNLYELTSRRLALRALDHKADSLEALVRKDIKGFENRIADMKDSEEIQTDVKKVYEAYGKSADLNKVNADLDASFKKAQVACYWTSYKNNQRVWNEEASSYVLALSVGEDNSGLSDIDVATIWTMEKIRKTAALTDKSYEYGGSNGNLLNISTRVARYLGKIGSAKNSNKEDLEQELTALQKSVDEAIEKATTTVKAELFACIEEHNKDCPTCIAEQKKQFESNRLNFDKIQRGLLQAVSTAENIKMEKALKAKMGTVDFDLSDFAVGTVPEDHRKRISKKDACGNPYDRKSTQAATQNVARKRAPAANKAAVKKKASPGVKKTKPQADQSKSVFKGKEGESTANRSTASAPVKIDYARLTWLTSEQIEFLKKNADKVRSVDYDKQQLQFK